MSLFRPHSRRRQAGHAVVEIALIGPWIFLLFAAALDMGFYNYAAISVENAARVAALRVSKVAGVSSAAGRQYVCAELATMPNVGSSCPTNVLTVSVTSIASGPDGAPAINVAVTYTTVQMIPLPWMRGQWTFTRQVEAKI